MDPATSQIPTQSPDVFSLSDQTLAERLEFIEEIGFGNWGSVWVCRAKSATTPEGVAKPQGQKLAVKLVHRSKTPTTAARVRSLWNEMKIVRSFKSDAHPSIIPFHSFIITPSYALITMAYLPTLVPVEVEETKAREWFRFLLSAVEFLHKRGVVHNDIKPANILVSHKNIPVLVDFGFAERYTLSSAKAFHSNLSYGTPEYLAPERARGLPHDTRKSDVWSLGITFFEILVGRTPFEETEGEQFNTNEDLEKYWARTLRGKWVGEWSFSKGMEQLLERMLASNADLRCTAMQAMADPYWRAPRKDTTPSLHRRTSSSNSSRLSSIIFENDTEKLMSNSPSSWRHRKERIVPPSPSPSAAKDSAESQDDESLRRAPKPKPQPKVNPIRATPRRRVQAQVDLSPIQASPVAPRPPTAASAKENISDFNRLASVANSSKEKAKKNKDKDTENQERRSLDVGPAATTTNTRRPLGDLSSSGNVPRSSLNLSRKSSPNTKPVKALVESMAAVNKENALQPVETKKAKESTTVRDRVRDWERERERLREMARLEELERDADDVRAQAKEAKKERRVPGHASPQKPKAQVPSVAKRVKKTVSHLQIKVVDPSSKANCDKENASSAKTTSALPAPRMPAQLAEVFNVGSGTPRLHKQTSKGSFRNSIRASIDKTIQLCKSSSRGGLHSGRSTPASEPWFDVTRPSEAVIPSMGQVQDFSEWETDEFLQEVNTSSPFPVAKSSADIERHADSRMDRMAVWMRNVERVVAKESLSSSQRQRSSPAPPVPPRKPSHNYRPVRPPRKIIAAREIFPSDPCTHSTPMPGRSLASTTNSSIHTGSTSRVVSSASANTSVYTDPISLAEKPKLVIPEALTPTRRRNTVSSRSPVSAEKRTSHFESPSKRREKARSHGNLLQMHIMPIEQLEAEVLKKTSQPPPSAMPPPTPPRRLSQVLDRNLFIAPPLTPREAIIKTPIMENKPSLDELTSSPCIVEAYPPRTLGTEGALVPDTPSRRRLENVYDRLLMTTSGVKRNGKGYQSDHTTPAPHTPAVLKKPFNSTRRPLPPPVSSDDIRRAISADEIGMASWDGGRVPHDRYKSAAIRPGRQEPKDTLMKRAIKLMVPSSNRKTSRVV